ncbi:MAG: DUF1902 domain-containing protein [Pseudomonadales bacterium]|nr:DUF1902 domain-containing protein [Pseudomonadales bacterium]
MKAPDLVIRCYVKRAHDQWVAVCVDLCLAAQADTQHEAKEKLMAQIYSYVEEALTVDKEFADELLNRKAPLHQRMEYWFILAAHKVNLLRTGIGQVFKTILPVHVGHNCHA